MNGIGKGLVVLVFVFSLVFMSLVVAVYATQKNWRELAQKQSAALQQMRTENSDLQAKQSKLVDDINREQQNRQQAVAKLETEKDTLQREYDTLLSRETQLVDDSRKSVAAMEAAHQTLAGLREEVTGLRQEIRTVQADRDAKFREAVDLTDKLHVAQGEEERLEAKNLDLLEQVSRQKTVLDRNGLDEFVPVDNVPPKVDGIVLATRDGGWVEISLGSDDGLRNGHTLEVYRANKYLGRIEVVKTAPDKSVAKIVRPYQQGAIQREDRVASRITN